MKKNMEESDTRDVINNQILQISDKQKHKKSKKTNPKKVDIKQVNIQQGNQIYTNQPCPKNQVNMTGNIIQQNGIIINQLAPVKVKAKPLDSIKFEINRKILVCPYCKRTVTTEVQKKFNYCTCICLTIQCILLPLLLCAAIASGDCGCGGSCSCSCCNCGNDTIEEEDSSVENPEIEDKESCNRCYDATHSCPECKKKLANHYSCPCKKIFVKICGEDDIISQS